MNILIIGATGFIGSHITSLLLIETRNSIRVYSPTAEDTYTSQKKVHAINGKIDDINKLREHAEWADVVIHLSSTTTPQTSISDPYFDSSTNLLPMIALLEIIKQRRSKIIFLSSGGSIYGNTKTIPINEDQSKNPNTPYGITKLAMEEYIQYYNLNYQIPYLIIRPSNVYGPNKRSVGKLGIINTLISNSFQDKETTIWANPGNIRDYIFIDDFIKAFETLFNMNAQGIYNVGSSKGYTINEIIRTVEKEIKKEMKISLRGKLIKDEPTNILDINKIRSKTGWNPEITLQDGIQKIISYFREKQ